MDDERAALVVEVLRSDRVWASQQTVIQPLHAVPEHRTYPRSWGYSKGLSLPLKKEFS